MKIGKNRAHHLCRRRSQAIAFGLVSAHVGNQTVGNAGLAIKLAHQRREIQDLKHAARQIVGAFGSVERGRLAHGVSQRNVTG